MGYIIVKYAKDHFPDGKAHSCNSIIDTHTAKQCGVNTKIYETKEAAQADLSKLNDYNPTGGYGIVESEKEQDLPQVTNSGSYL